MNFISSVTKKTEMHYGPAHQELFCFDISVLNSKVVCIHYEAGLHRSCSSKFHM